MSTPNPDQIREAIFAGKKIQAIKHYREQTGAGLVAAKQAVEKLEAELRTTSPELFSQTTPAKGCFATVALFAAASVALGLLVYRLA